ncbi:P-loop NTPase fold protein [Burkholderia ubonensis]|uniref:P-loop NTPase fold protein n=1 Tax=Burkholderia ubonensis TaxID=101571 RepID=UPI00075232E1|nr:P-loop NTPase fold protein [Burkholderia ubonensis]KVO24016.1 hypothetical protein WJ72_30130 [Burkholderia ubonensis]KVQ82206.1 hypothetical protein WK05_26200 [Burkholderia ubonensis]KVV33596.1 hypothetical protein WK79_32185 [Burkholderia ubonensis]KVZ79284.1 hypothetical protein WL22_04375 [Burkholderia ubonensis]KWE29763.1 hypothetical protein WL75_03410 [Burkholderia ubonensis]
MALTNIQKNFAAAIEDAQAQVVALSGNWGTGKTHLWEQYKKNSDIPYIQKAISVSLFGVRTIHALKMKLLAVWAEGAEGDNKIGSIMTGGASAFAKILKGLHRSAEAVDDVVLLGLPSLLRDAFVVLDDIERKHNLLEIDEILGFIDEFTAKHRTRFLLILNTDKLGDKAIWEKFREKVIHHEIALEITSDDAFDIANVNNASTYAAAMKRTNQVIGVTNIRVLSKAIAFIERLFKNHSVLEDKVQERFVPSAFLLCALHYNVLPDGPTFDYVLGFNSLVETAAATKKGSNDETTQRWSDLMDRLGLFKSDQFERVVATALRTGLIEYGALDEAIIAYQRPWQAQYAAKRVRDFVHDYSWDHKKSDMDLSSEAKSMLDMAEHMDADTISALCSVVLQIDQSGIADDLVQRWLTTHNFTPEEASNILGTKTNEHLHPTIAEQLRLTAGQTTSLSRDLAAVAQRIQGNYYFEEDEQVIATSSVEQYVQTLKSLDKEEFADFIRMHLGWVRYGKNRPWRTAGLEIFFESCARIVEGEPHTRLAGILRRVVFNGATTDLRNKVQVASD